MSAYTIGIDFGTLSTRAVVVDVLNGSVLGAHEFAYPHGVMTESLPDGQKLPERWALQHPQDYLDALKATVIGAVAASGVEKDKIVGIGVDFTASTTLPVTKEGIPLCFLPRFQHNKHAYVKLWKHHGALAQTEHINRVCEQIKPAFLSYYGGKYDCEWPLPKLLQILQEAPEVYDAMAAWVEAGDWIVWQLTGRLSKCVSSAGVKEQYNLRAQAYPDPEFLGAIDARLRDFYSAKLSPKPLKLGTKAGNLTPAMAKTFGLSTNVCISAANMDGHVSAPVIGMERPGQLMSVIGTSCGWFALTKGEPARKIPGICCAAEDSMWPGMVCYEAGQSCVGDMYQWLSEGFVPPNYHKAAREQGLTVQQYLTRLAAGLRPGQSGLLMLDWLNGNRSILSDAKLSSMILGLTLQTRPEEVYRAALEACAFGARMIVENYTSYGIAADSVIASGGISRKNELAMQIYADVLGLPIHIAGTEYGPAHGAALFAAVAAGCYADVPAASAAMKQPFLKTYWPSEKSKRTYDMLYAQYKTLYRYFGQGQNDVMKTLMRIRQAADSQEESNELRGKGC